MFTLPPRHEPDQTVDDVLSGASRRLGPPVPVITVTRGIDPLARRDPAARDDASPYFATSSEAPRTP
jgi:hypothetical protein